MHCSECDERSRSPVAAQQCCAPQQDLAQIATVQQNEECKKCSTVQSSAKIVECAENSRSTTVQQNDNAEKERVVKIQANAGAAQIEGKEGPQRPTLKEKVFGTISPLKKLVKFCIYGVQSKLQSFNLLDTAVDKNPTLLKQQQSIDPFVQAIKHFVK